MAFCGQCGEKLAKGDNFCAACGSASFTSKTPDHKLEGDPSLRIGQPFRGSRETTGVSGGTQNAKSRRFSDAVGPYRSWVAVFAAAIVVSLILLAVTFSVDRPGSADRRGMALAQEVCDTSILLEPAPATAEGRAAWQEFGEKGEELRSMEGANELVFIGQAASQLAWATEVEVNLGGGLPTYQDPAGELRYWWEYAGPTWETAGDNWATLCNEANIFP